MFHEPGFLACCVAHLFPGMDKVISPTGTALRPRGEPHPPRGSFSRSHGEPDNSRPASGFSRICLFPCPGPPLLVPSLSCTLRAALRVGKSGCAGTWASSIAGPAGHPPRGEEQAGPCVSKCTPERSLSFVSFKDTLFNMQGGDTGRR